MRSCAIACGDRPHASLNAHVTIGGIFKRLPVILQDKFLSSVSAQLERGEPVTFFQLSEFMHKRSQLENSYLGQIVSNRKTSYTNTSDKNKKPYKASFFATQSSVRDQPRNDPDHSRDSAKCPCCSDIHPLWKCHKFNSLPLSDRWHLIKSERLCFNCFGNHLARRCRSNQTCRICSKWHHTLLHQDQTKVRNSFAGNDNGAGTACSSAATVGDNSEEVALHVSSQTNYVERQPLAYVRLKVVPVVVSSLDGKRSLKTYAFLDEGFDTTLCTDDVMTKLNLRRQRVDYSIATLEVR